MSQTPGSELFPGDSASLVGDSSVGPLGGGYKGAKEEVVDDGTYLFKFVAPGGTTHRFQARYDEYQFIIDIVAGKLSSDPFFNAKVEEEGEEKPDPKDFGLCYYDDDGDLVMMTADRDIVDAVTVAKKQGKDRVVLHLRGGKGWEVKKPQVEPVPVVVTPPPAPSPVVKEEVVEKRSKRKEVEKEELVFGFLTKDQLLPASVAFLAVAIVGVFAVSKATAR